MKKYENPYSLNQENKSRKYEQLVGFKSRFDKFQSKSQL